MITEISVEVVGLRIIGRIKKAESAFSRAIHVGFQVRVGDLWGFNKIRQSVLPFEMFLPICGSDFDLAAFLSLILSVGKLRP